MFDQPNDAASWTHNGQKTGTGAPEDLEVLMACAARHESGHLAIAAVKGLRLRAEALFLDRGAEGLACYCKQPDTSDYSHERIIIATFAGYYAERRFRVANSHLYMPADEFFLRSVDGREARELLVNMPAARLFNGSVPATHVKLQGESESLVGCHWPAIESLAAALLAKGWELLRPLKSGVAWSQEAAAKYLPGEEAVSILAQHGIAASSVLDC